MLSQVSNCDGIVLDIDIGSQTPVTTGGFELQISCIRCSYLFHCMQEVLSSNPDVDAENHEYDTIPVWNLVWRWSIWEILLDKWLGRAFFLKHKAEPYNEAELPRAFETLRENKKVGWEFEKLGQVFKALLRVCIITQPMLS